MQQWKKRGDYRSVAEAVQGMSGLTLEELRSPAHVEPETIENLAACGEALKQWAIQDGLPVVIVGDYDADGITSTAILVKLLRHFGVTPQTIIPRRFTDGYGINETLIEGISEHSIRMLITQGKIKAFRTGEGVRGKYLVNKESLLSYFSGNEEV